MTTNMSLKGWDLLPLLGGECLILAPMWVCMCMCMCTYMRVHVFWASEFRKYDNTFWPCLVRVINTMLMNFIKICSIANDAHYVMYYLVPFTHLIYRYSPVCLVQIPINISQVPSLVFIQVCRIWYHKHLCASEFRTLDNTWQHLLYICVYISNLNAF